MNKLNVVMVIAKTPDTERYRVMEKRSDHPDPRYDKTPFETAGGKIEPDESVDEAALRELDEETGLDGTIINTGTTYTRTDPNRTITFYPVLVHVNTEHVTRGSEEHTGYAWLSRDGFEQITTPTEQQAFTELIES